jgi:hypothetical protein
MIDDPEIEKRIGQLEDQLKQAERRIAELKAERDEARDLAQRMEEHVTDANALIESWIESFDMKLNDKGLWAFDDWVDGCAAAQDKYRALLREWNKFVPKYNSVIAPKGMGRRLDASDAQVAHVLRLRKTKTSLRAIAEETNLSLQTVRTIVDRDQRTDRTSLRRLARVDPDRAAELTARARKRTRAGLPRRINELLKQGDGLRKEARNGNCSIEIIKSKDDRNA